MCAVSMVIDSMNYQWGQPSFNNWQLPQLYDFQEVIKRLDALDKKFSAPDCVDEKKDAVIKDLEERIKILESKISLA